MCYYLHSYWHLEVESALLRSRLCSECVRLLAHVHLGGELGILFLSSEIVLQDLNRLLVDIVIVMALEQLNFIETLSLLHERNVSVDAVGIMRVLVANLEDVLKSLESNSDHTCIGSRQEIAQRLDATLVDEEPYLLWGTTRGCV